MDCLKMSQNSAQKIETAPGDIQAFFDLAPDLFCVFGTAGNFQKINSSVTRILGWSSAELVRTSWLELVHQDDVFITLATMQHCQPEHPCNLLNRCRHKDGSYQSLSWSLSRSTEGLIYAIARQENAQAWKMGEKGESSGSSSLVEELEALKKERQSLYALLEQLPVFLHIRSKNSVGFYNQRFKKIFGEPKNKPCFALQGEVASEPECYTGSDEPAIAKFKNQLCASGNEESSSTSAYNTCTEEPAIAKPQKSCSLCPTCGVFASQAAQTWEWIDRRTGRTYEIYNYPFKDINGEFKVVEMGLDITESKQQRLWNVLELIFNEIYIFDAETLQFQYVNARARRNLGYSMAQMQNLTAFDIKPGTSEAEFRRAIAPLFSGEKDKLEFQTIHQRKDGSTYPVEVHLQVIEETGDRKFLAVILDITERLKVEAALRSKEAQIQQKAIQLEKSLHQLQRTQMQLIQSEKMSSLGQLVAGVAHEINNPISFIHGNLPHVQRCCKELLGLLHLYQKQYPLPSAEIQAQIEASDLEFLLEDLPKILNSIKIGTDRIREIVLSLRNFSRHDESEMKAVDIHTGIDSTLLILHNRLKPKPDFPEIQIIKQYSVLPSIECYPGQLNQVFMNILANAIDALETQSENRSISISTSIAGVATGEETEEDSLDVPSIRIQIADTGPGIPEKARDRIFEPFFTTKPIGKGTGLGLSICYSIVVNRHKGKLHFVSTPAQGTKFIIEIPIRQSPK